MGIGTLGTTGRVAALPSGGHRRRGQDTMAMALAVAASYGLLALIALGAVPHLVRALLRSRSRPKRP